MNRAAIETAASQRVSATTTIETTPPLLNTVHTPAKTGQSPQQARLMLSFEKDNGITRLSERDHYGPLLVQKPFYPESKEVCHVVIVHPPGGILGGDKLSISAHVGTSAHAQITTPGASKWYKANSHISHQKICIDVQAGGSLEWVPQETIYFDNADVVTDHQVSLEKDSTYIGCEIACFGRTASGESFNKGQIRQRTSIQRDGKMIWLEQMHLRGGSSAMKDSLALSSNTVCATLILAGKTLAQPLIDLARAEAENLTKGKGQTGISQFKSIIVARYLGNSSEIARHVMLQTWALFRPELLGHAGIVPRMWNT